METVVPGASCRPHPREAKSAIWRHFVRHRAEHIGNRYNDTDLLYSALSNFGLNLVANVKIPGEFDRRGGRKERSLDETIDGKLW